MRGKEKIKFEVDPFNRLVYRKTGKESGVREFRTELEGEFQTDKNNFLAYRVKNPSSPVPQQFKLSGNWSLDDNHNLVFTLDKENNQRQGDRLTLEGALVSAQGDELAFGLATINAGKNQHFYLIKLKGIWQADRQNCLSFLVTKEQGPADELKLSGSWEINRQNQIIYTYTKAGLKTKDKLAYNLTFKGYWDISEKNRVSYVLNEAINSKFDFRVGLGKPGKNGLRYEIGIGRQGVRKEFFIFGAWKVNEKLGLILETPLEEGKTRSIVFGASCKMDKNYTLELKLKNGQNQDLGIKIELLHTFLKGLGQAYLEMLKEGKELSLVAGVGVRW